MFNNFKSHIATQIITGLVIAFATLGVIVIVIGYYLFTESIENQYASKAYNTIRTAVSDVDPSIFDKTADLEETKNKIDFLRERWQKLVDTQDGTFIYMYQRMSNENYDFMRVVLSVMNSKLRYNVFSSGMIIRLPDEDKPGFKELYEDGRDQAVMPMYREEFSDDSYLSGDHVTVLIPVHDAKGNIAAVIGVERKMDELKRVRGEYVHNISFATFMFLLLVIIFYTAYLNKRLLAPVEEISAEAQRFAHDNTKPEVELSATIKSKDEIGSLAKVMDKMEDDVINYVNNLTRVTQEKEQIKAELNLAANIQIGILPKEFPVCNEYEIHAVMIPAKEVGGDLYDFFMIDKDHLALIIADVSGKGVPASLFMMTAKALMKNRAKMGGKPSEILYDVNMQLCEGNEAELFVTVWLGILELSTGKAVAANAGHEYPAIKHVGGKYELLKTKNSPALAAMEGMRFKDTEFELSPGDIVYVYTDGVAEATDFNNKLFGTDRMLDALNEIDDNVHAEDVLDFMKLKIDEFIDGAPQFDDITMICLKYLNYLDKSKA